MGLDIYVDSDRTSSMRVGSYSSVHATRRQGVLLTVAWLQRQAREATIRAAQTGRKKSERRRGDGTSPTSCGGGSTSSSSGGVVDTSKSKDDENNDDHSEEDENKSRAGGTQAMLRATPGDKKDDKKDDVDMAREDADSHKKRLVPLASGVDGCQEETVAVNAGERGLCSSLLLDPDGQDAQGAQHERHAREGFGVRRRARFCATAGSEESRKAPVGPDEPDEPGATTGTDPSRELEDRAVEQKKPAAERLANEDREAKPREAVKDGAAELGDGDKTARRADDDDDDDHLDGAKDDKEDEEEEEDGDQDDEEGDQEGDEDDEEGDILQFVEERKSIAALLSTWCDPAESRSFFSNPMRYDVIPERLPDLLVSRATLPLAGMFWWVQHSDCDGSWSSGQCQDVDAWLSACVLSDAALSESDRDYYGMMRDLFSLAARRNSLVRCS